MLFILGAVIGGLVAGTILGGSLRRLERFALRKLWLLVAAVVVQLLTSLLLAHWAYALGLLVSLGLAAGFLLRNPQLAGRGLLIAGLALNAAVIVANDAMPVSLSAAGRAGVSTGPLLDDPRHEIAGPDTRLTLLEDRIPLPLPVSPQVLSAGDVLVAAGIGLLLAQGMRRRTTVPPPVTVAPVPLALDRPIGARHQAPTGTPGR